MLFIFNIILGTIRQVFLYTAELPSVFTNYFLGWQRCNNFLDDWVHSPVYDGYISKQLCIMGV